MEDAVLVDANVIVRFVVRDDKEFFVKAEELFLAAGNGKIKIYVDEVGVAETIWILTSFYQKPKGEVVDALQLLLGQNWVLNPRKKLIVKALEMFQMNNLSYIDCWLAVVSQKLGCKLETFDKKLKKLSK